MLSRKVKATFFCLAKPVLKLNGIFYRNFRAPRQGIVKVHLGPGQKSYLGGWINLDANMFTGKCDVWVDLRNPLPFHDSTVDVIYSHHFIEHLPNLKSHLREVYRCLKPNAIYRVGGPNGDSAIKKFISNDLSWFSDFPDNRSSIGGRFENFIFCRQEHLTILTSSFLNELMKAAGFINIRTCVPTQTNYPRLIDKQVLEKEWESTFDCPHTLIVECQKPFI